MGNEVFAPYDLPQLYNAMRLLKYEQAVDEHVSLDYVCIPSATVTFTISYPADRLDIQRYMLEWGDPSIYIRWSVDAPLRYVCYAHYVPPNPAYFEFSRHTEKRSSLILVLTNLDPVNYAEYHMEYFPVLVTTDDWKRWREKLKKEAEEWLEQ
jgi:hypothetical protein